jgi:CBS domain-containing protein
MSRRGPREPTAKDIMRTKVLSVDPDMTVQDVMQFFLDCQITGAPVVDDTGRVVGVVSQSDLLRHQQRVGPAPMQAPAYYRESNGEVLLTHMRVETPLSARVQDIMTPAAFMTEQDTPVGDIARFMLRRRVHRIIVTRKGRLAGIITSMDLLRALVRQQRSARSSRPRRQTVVR